MRLLFRLMGCMFRSFLPPFSGIAPSVPCGQFVAFASQNVGNMPVNLVDALTFRRQTGGRVAQVLGATLALC